jgi:glutathione S-transferase
MRRDEAMKLFGHAPSPFVRRIRVLLDELGIAYDRDPSGWQEPSAEFVAATPVRRVPMLDRGPERTTRYVYDSRVIAGVLYGERIAPNAGPPPFQATLYEANLGDEDQNIVTTVDAAVESLVNVFLLEKDGITGAQAPYLMRQVERAKGCFAWLDATYGGKTTITPGVLAFTDVAVACAVDWVGFRQRLDLTPYPHVRAVAEAHRERPSFVSTRPT